MSELPSSLLGLVSPCRKSFLHSETFNWTWREYKSKNFLEKLYQEMIQHSLGFRHCGHFLSVAELEVLNYFFLHFKRIRYTYWRWNIFNFYIWLLRRMYRSVGPTPNHIMLYPGSYPYILYLNPCILDPTPVSLTLPQNPWSITPVF